MPGRWCSFFITCPDLQESFEIRWHFTEERWTATVHPMDGPSRRSDGSMDEPFGAAFARVFGAFNAAHLIPVAQDRAAD